MRRKVEAIVHGFLLGKGSVSCAAASLVVASVFLRESHVLWRQEIAVKSGGRRSAIIQHRIHSHNVMECGLTGLHFPSAKDIEQPWNMAAGNLMHFVAGNGQTHRLSHSGRANLKEWGDQRDSNPQHPESQSGALPIELWPPTDGQANFYARSRQVFRVSKRER